MDYSAHIAVAFEVQEGSWSGIVILVVEADLGIPLWHWEIVAVDSIACLEKHSPRVCW